MNVPQFAERFSYGTPSVSSTHSRHIEVERAMSQASSRAPERDDEAAGDHERAAYVDRHIGKGAKD